jgi:glycosyltransferase involved in cell wall biosynthesis
MRVIHLITGLDQGGAEAMLEKLLLTGRRINPEIEQAVLSLAPPGIVGERLTRAGVNVQSLGLRMPRMVGQLWRLTHQLRRQRADTIVQTWLWHADLVGGLCARAAGNPRVVWNLRNSMPDLATTKLPSRVVARLCAALSGWLPAQIVCNSEAALHAHTAIGYDRRKCLVIPNGFDLRMFAPSATARQQLRASWGLAPEERLVGMVARVDVQKDHATFIQAAARVARITADVRFLLVGTGVTTDSRIRTLLNSLSLRQRFILQERREEVPPIMNALDVFCLASKSEGFPNVLGEAMACATPAVATDVGDVREILGDDRFVAAASDPEHLAACILNVLLLTPAERRALGLAQRATIQERFDIERVWGRYRDLYCVIAASRSRPEAASSANS